MQTIIQLNKIKYFTILSIIKDYLIYYKSNEVRDKVLKVQESKLFSKLELATI